MLCATSYVKSDQFNSTGIEATSYALLRREEGEGRRGRTTRPGMALRSTMPNPLRAASRAATSKHMNTNGGARWEWEQPHETRFALHDKLSHEPTTGSGRDDVAADLANGEVPYPVGMPNGKSKAEA